MQKPNALTRTGQAYTATFIEGTLYYLLRAGAKSSDVTSANIKNGAYPEGAGTNKGSATVSPKEISLTGLRAGKQYTLYALAEASNGVQSVIAATTFQTLAVPVPSLAAKDGSLTKTGQAYTATFSVGMLYYLLQAGPHSGSVTHAQVKTDGTPAGASTNKGSAATASSPKDLVLTGLQADTQYTLYAFVEDGGDLSAIVHETFTTLFNARAPTLVAKQGSRTNTGQAYTATFTGGTLYYLLRAGAKSGDVTGTNIKDGANPAGAGTNKGSAATSPKEISLTGLQAGTRYTLYALVEASGGAQSVIITATFKTAIPPAPIIAQNPNALTNVSQTYTVTFTGGTLYYLLRSGWGSLEGRFVKGGLLAVSGNKGSVAESESPKEIVLEGLAGGGRYTFYTLVEASNGVQSAVAQKAFDTKRVVSPNAPTLAQKPDALTNTGQAYTAAFTGGTLYYLLRAGEKSVDVTGANIKGGADPAGADTNKGSSTTSPKEISLTGLQAGTKYTLYALMEVGSAQSTITTETFTTTANVISPPTYTASVATQTTIQLTGGSDFSGDADMRRFYISKSDLEPLVIGNAVDHAVSGVEGEVWTFSLASGSIETVTVGSGTPEANKALEPNTRYYIRAVDYKSDDAKSGLSDDLGETTAPKKRIIVDPPLGPDSVWGTMEESKFYAYPNPTFGVLHVSIPDGTAQVFGSDGAQVGSFVIAAGQIDLGTLPSGTYMLRLSDGSVLRVVKQ